MIIPGFKIVSQEAEKFGFEESFETHQKAAASRFPEDPDESQTAQAAIGQFDVRATTLQMAMVAAAVSNRGITMRPGIVDQTTAPDLSPLDTFEPTDFARAMSEENAAELAEMMVGVVENGTGSSAQIPGVAVGGNLQGQRLVALPLTTTSWAGWAAKHPNGGVYEPEAR